MLSSIVIVLCAVVSTCLGGGGKTIDDFPLCCKGGQVVIKMMADYVKDDFKDTMDLLEEKDADAFCEQIEKDVNSLHRKLSAEGDECRSKKNTGESLIDYIARKLNKVNDECMANVGFIRAMFDLVGECTAHMPSEHWTDVNEQFSKAIRKIDQLEMDGIDHIRFEGPDALGGAHGRKVDAHPKHIGIKTRN